MQTVDLATGRLSRKLPTGKSWAIPIFGPEPRVVFSGKDMPVKLYSPRGTLESPDAILSRQVLFAAVSPDGKGLLLAASREDPAAASSPIPTRCRKWRKPKIRDSSGSSWCAPSPATRGSG